MPSSLSKRSHDGIKAIHDAYFLYRSHKEKTVFVEGKKDVRFYKEFKISDLRIIELGDKEEVLKAYTFCSTNSSISDKTFAHFIVDIDKDYLLNNRIISDPNFNYHVWNVSQHSGFNDLETYLVSSRAFEKLLVNYDIEIQEINIYRKNLFESGSCIGAYRLADEQVQKEKKLEHSILEGFELDEDLFRELFDDKMKIKIKALEDFIDRRVSRKACGALLLDAAKNNIDNKSSEYALCRGHDLSLIIAYALMARHKQMHNERDLHIDGDIIELDLRLAAEKAFLDQSEFSNYSFWGLL
jgi:hypothetical protein